MKGKIKRLLTLCVSFVAFVFCGIFVACSTVEKTALSGFDVQTTVNVDYGELVKLETPIVTDADGRFYEVMSEVCDSKGGYVVVEANAFRAWDVNGYTIRYVVRVSNAQVEEKTTKVTVTDTQALTVTATYNEFEDTGKNILILPECDEADVEWTYTVKKLKDDSGVTVTAGEGDAYFVCDEAGYYDVEIQAKKGERYGSFGYTLIVREAVDETVVEHFDAQWTEVAQYLGDERIGRYELVSGADIGLKDRYGDDAYYLTFTSVAEWLTYHISPRYDKAHYEKLLEEGYDQVTLYCYVVSEQNKSHTYAIRTMTSGFYERSSVTSYPNQWNEINMNLDLIHGSEVSRSFLAAYDYYKSQEGWFLCYNNEGPQATRDVLTLYFSDMYVTKPVSITVAEDATTEYTVGDTLSLETLKTVFASESDLRYYVTFRGERSEITADYEFKANGEYTVEALSARKDERGSKSVTFTVTDGFNASYTYLAEERTADAAAVNLNELHAAFAETDGVTPVVSGYKVYDRYGVEYAVTNNEFLAPADGAYSVEVEGKYEISGTEYKTYDTVYVDVWSQATKYKVAAVEDMYSANAWEYQSTRKQSITVDEYTVGGVTDKMFRLVKSGDNITLTVKPFYTKQYYVNLIENSSTDLVFAMNAYFDGITYPDTPTMNTSRSIFANYLKCEFAKNVWTMQVSELSAFVEKYDDLVAGYEQQTYNVSRGIKYGYAVNGDWKNYIFYSELTKRAEYVYVTDMVICPIETVEETQLVERTGDSVALMSLTSAFDGLNFTPAAIVKATKNGTDTTVTGDAFTVGTNDGVYEVLVKGVKNGEASVVKLTVDVWSEATKNVVVALEDYFSIAGYEYQSFIKDVLTVGEYTLGDKTETLVRLYAAGRECSVVVAKPLHSKKYYQELLAKDGYYTSYVTLDWYFENTSAYTSNITPYYDMFTGYEKLGAQEKDTWHSGRITLAEFVALYDDMVALYERTVNEYNTGVRYGRFVDTKGVVDQDGNVQKGYVMATKFQTNKIDYAYFAPMTIETEMTNVQSATLLVDRKTTTSLDIEALLDTETSVSYWESQGYTIEYALTARYGGAKVNNGATFTIGNSVENGVYYLTVTATKGEENGVCLSKTIDVYHSDEPVEYENFKHTDSHYAVLSYLGYTKGSWLSTSGSSVNVASIESNVQAGYWNVDYLSNATNAAANTIYTMRFGSCASGSGGEVNIDHYNDGRTVGYIEHDWTTASAWSGIDSFVGTLGSYSGGINLFTYVLPRHSVEYYEAYADTHGKFMTAYKGSTISGAQSDTGFRYNHVTDIADGKAILTYNRVWSAENQGHLANDMQMTIQTLIDNYDAFASAKIPMQIIFQVHDDAAETSVKASRLYEIFFVENE